LTGWRCKVVPIPRIIFVWQKNQPEVEKYWLELDITDQFSAPVFSDSTITDTTLLYTSLINGEYWWRVKAGNLSDWGEFSEVRTFNVNIVSVEEDNPDLWLDNSSSDNKEGFVKEALERVTLFRPLYE